jgi:hypothetical protein
MQWIKDSGNYLLACLLKPSDSASPKEQFTTVSDVANMSGNAQRQGENMSLEEMENLRKFFKTAVPPVKPRITIDPAWRQSIGFQATVAERQQ